MEVALAIVVSPREWAERLHRFLADHGGARVRTRVMRPDDAIREHYDVFLVDDVTSFLTPRLVRRLQDTGRRVLGVYDPDEFPEGRERLVGMGADGVIESQATAEEFVRLIASLHPAQFGSVESVTDQTSLVEPVADSPRVRRGPVTVVGGPPGGSGTTEVAITLAACLAGAAGSTVLVDADDVAPAIAQRLQLDLHPNVRSAVDALQHRTGRLLSTVTSPRRLGFGVLPGLSNRDDWSELRPGEVVDVVFELASACRQVVVNVSSNIEDLSSHGGPGRYGLARRLVTEADAVVGVGLPTPVGVARLLEWVADVRAVAEDIPIHLVVNRSPRSVFKRGELIEEIARTFFAASVTFAAFDRKVEEAAWEGRLVAPGHFTKALSRLAALLASSTQPRTSEVRA